VGVFGRGRSLANAMNFDPTSNLFREHVGQSAGKHQTTVDTYVEEKRDLEIRIANKQDTSRGIASSIYNDEQAKFKLMAAVHMLRTQMDHKKKEKATNDKSVQDDTCKLNQLEQRYRISRDVMEKKYQPYAVSVDKLCVF
jgi:hypothetical protein